MRLFFAGVMHEASFHSPIPTTLASFAEQFWDPNVEPVEPEQVDTCAYGPAWRLALERGHACIAAPYTMAQPSAPMQDAAWVKMRDDILERLRAALPVDGVFLMLHGAQSSFSEPDCEGDLLRCARDVVGPNVAIGAVLDLHTNMTQTMLETATFLIGCKEYPHTDYPERGAEMLDLLESAHEGRIHPVMRAVRVPALGLFPTTVEPMAAYVRALSAAEVAPVLSLSALHGFFDADNNSTGAAVIAITDGDAALARREARRFGQGFLDLVSAQKPLGLSLFDALTQARAANGLVVLADVADNPGGGAAGDDTLILETLVKDWPQPCALGMIWDPVSVQFCHDVGVGGTLNLRIGGKIGPFSGTPVDLKVTVTSVRDDAKQSAFGIGPARLPLGRTACVRWRDLDIVLTDRRQQVFSRHCFSEHGIDLTQKSLVSVKSTQHFYRDFAALSQNVIWCDPRQMLLPSPTHNPYKRVRRPVFPIDPIDAVKIEDF
jgi:microcystin degradation protein MlrC